MTVSSQTNNETFAGNSVTTIWSLPFRFFDNTDIFVYLVDPIADTSTPMVLGTDYTLTGAGLPEQFGAAPGKITTTVPVATGKNLYVERVMGVEQLTDIVNQGRFFAEIHEDVFDRLTMLIQQSISFFGRALVRPVGKDYYDAEGRLISNVADPVNEQDAATKHWSRIYLTSIISAIQGPINNALNIFYKGPDNLDYVVQDMSNTTDRTKGAALIGGALRKGEVMDPNGTAPGTSVTRGYVHAYYPELAGALRVGGSDLVPLNDEKGYWVGLPSQNAWGNPLNIGLYSVAFNRNGASYGTYSATFGHDCVAYGVASIAGGAGSGTGNPGDPDLAFTGYCAIAFGKNCLASGEKSVSLGENNLVNTRAGVALGYSVTSQPSVATPDPVGALGMGGDVFLGGQAYGIGRFLSVSDGVLIGTGIQQNMPLSSYDNGELALGMRASLPAFRMTSPVGTERNKVCINNYRAAEHELDIDISNGGIVGVTLDDTGGSAGFVSLRGVNASGLSHPIANIGFTNPSTSSPSGVLFIRMNGRGANAFAISADGSIQMSELKTEATVSGSPAGTLYRDASGFLKVV